MPDEGEILLDGKKVQFHSPKDAIERGIGMVHQHFMLVPTLTILENVILGREPTRGLTIDMARAAARRLGLSNVRHEVGDVMDFRGGESFDAGETFSFLTFNVPGAPSPTLLPVVMPGELIDMGSGGEGTDLE